MISRMELTSKEHELDKGRQPTIHPIPNPRIEQYPNPSLTRWRSVAFSAAVAAPTTPGAAAALEKKSNGKMAS